MVDILCNRLQTDFAKAFKAADPDRTRWKWVRSYPSVQLHCAFQPFGSFMRSKAVPFSLFRYVSVWYCWRSLHIDINQAEKSRKPARMSRAFRMVGDFNQTRNLGHVQLHIEFDMPEIYVNKTTGSPEKLWEINPLHRLCSSCHAPWPSKRPRTQMPNVARLKYFVIAPLGEKRRKTESFPWGRESLLLFYRHVLHKPMAVTHKFNHIHDHSCAHVAQTHVFICEWHPFCFRLGLLHCLVSWRSQAKTPAMQALSAKTDAVGRSRAVANVGIPKPSAASAILLPWWGCSCFSLVFWCFSGFLNFSIYLIIDHYYQQQ